MMSPLFKKKPSDASCKPRKRPNLDVCQNKTDFLDCPTLGKCTEIFILNLICYIKSAIYIEVYMYNYGMNSI